VNSSLRNTLITITLACAAIGGSAGAYIEWARRHPPVLQIVLLPVSMTVTVVDERGAEYKRVKPSKTWAHTPSFRHCTSSDTLLQPAPGRSAPQVRSSSCQSRRSRSCRRSIVFSIRSRNRSWNKSAGSRATASDEVSIEKEALVQLTPWHQLV
jgi:hypothetical protein